MMKNVTFLFVAFTLAAFAATDETTPLTKGDLRPIQKELRSLEKAADGAARAQEDVRRSVEKQGSDITGALNSVTNGQNQVKTSVEKGTAATAIAVANEAEKNRRELQRLERVILSSGGLIVIVGTVLVLWARKSRSTRVNLEAHDHDFDRINPSIDTVRDIARRQGNSIVNAKFKHDKCESVFDCTVELRDGANDLVHYINPQKTVRWNERFNIIPKLISTRVAVNEPATK